MSEEWKFSPEKLREILSSKFIGKKILFFDKVSSTFDKAKEVELSDGLVIFAREQSHGKGRLGRSWESQKGGLYFSIILSAKHFKNNMEFSTIICALSVQKAIGKFVDAYIKWPNDIITKEGKKLCGILTKVNFSGENADFINIGIGINSNNSSFSKALPYASSMKDEAKKEIDENKLMCNVFEFIEKFMEYDAQRILKEFSMCCITVGAYVRAIYSQTGKEITGLCKGVNSDGSLTIESKDFGQITVRSGEVSVRGIYGEEYV